MKTLSEYDFPDRRWEPDGYNMKEVPDATPPNFRILLDHVNKLTTEFNALKERVTGEKDNNDE